MNDTKTELCINFIIFCMYMKNTTHEFHVQYIYCLVLYEVVLLAKGFCAGLGFVGSYL